LLHPIASTFFGNLHFFEQAPRIGQPLCDLRLIRQAQEVFPCEDLVREISQRIVGDDRVLLGTKN
jgi:hypothetical protein